MEDPRAIVPPNCNSRNLTCAGYRVAILTRLGQKNTSVCIPVPPYVTKTSIFRNTSCTCTPYPIRRARRDSAFRGAAAADAAAAAADATPALAAAAAAANTAVPDIPTATGGPAPADSTRHGAGTVNSGLQHRRARTAARVELNGLCLIKERWGLAGKIVDALHSCRAFKGAILVVVVVVLRERTMGPREHVSVRHGRPFS